MLTMPKRHVATANTKQSVEPQTPDVRGNHAVAWSEGCAKATQVAPDGRLTGASGTQWQASGDNQTKCPVMGTAPRPRPDPQSSYQKLQEDTSLSFPGPASRDDTGPPKA